MFYLFQMSDGRWHVDALTRAPDEARRIVRWIEGSETRAEAERKRQEAIREYAALTA